MRCRPQAEVCTGLHRAGVTMGMKAEQAAKVWEADEAMRICRGTYMPLC